MTYGREGCLPHQPAYTALTRQCLGRSLGKMFTFAAAESSPLLSDSFASPLVLLALAACSFASLEAFAYRQQPLFSRRQALHVMHPHLRPSGKARA